MSRTIIVDKSLFRIKIGVDNNTCYRAKCGVVYQNNNTTYLDNGNLQLSSEVTTTDDIVRSILMFGATNYKLELLPDDIEVKVPEPEPKVIKLTREDVITRLKDGFLNFADSDLSGLDLSNLNFHSANFSRANLTLTKFINSKLDFGVFTDANAHRSDFTGVTSYSAIFQNTNFYEAILRKGNFSNSMFSKADLESANISGAILINVDFTDAKLTGIITER